MQLISTGYRCTTLSTRAVGLGGWAFLGAVSLHKAPSFIAAWSPGFQRHMLAADLAPPRLPVKFALATDDVMVFGRGCPSAGARAVANLDAAILKAGIQPHAEKNVDGVADTTCIGVDFCGGRYAVPSASKLCLVIVAVAHLLSVQPELAPDELAAILGQFAWFAMLNRPTLSALHAVYDFSRKGGKERVPVPAEALAELALFVSLLPFIEADLWREWQNCIVASDASKSFGFGVSVAPCRPEFTRDVAHSCMLPQTYLRLDRSGEHPDNEAERPRKGKPCYAKIGKGAFISVLSVRAKFAAHSGSLEAVGVALALRWLLRAASRHSRRTLFLIDAQTVLGAVAKGRSSAPTIRRDTMRVAALLLAGDVQPYYAYAPSEDNPADAPSRGIMRRWRRQQLGQTWRRAGSAAARRATAPRGVKQLHGKVRHLSAAEQAWMHRRDRLKEILRRYAAHDVDWY